MNQNSFPLLFYPKSHIPSYNSSCINVYMCVCVYTCTCAILCVSEGHLVLSFFKKWKFCFKSHRFFQYCHTVYVQNVSMHFVFNWMSFRHFNFLLKSILFQKEKYFCKVFVSYYIIWFIRISSFFRSESEFEGWLQNFRFYKWVKSKTLIFFFSNVASLSFDSMVLGQIVKGNLRCKKIPQFLNCLIIRKVGPHMINWIVFILYTPY